MPSLLPSKVFFVILTDGQENSSREFSQFKVADMIKEQTEKYSWEFVYVGANQDAFAVGQSLNIAVNNVQNYAATSIGTRSVFSNLSKGMASRRDGSNTKGYFDNSDGK